MFNAVVFTIKATGAKNHEKNSRLQCDANSWCIKVTGAMLLKWDKNTGRRSIVS